jgi:transposase
MARKSEAISEELVLRCKEELKKQGIRGENGRRLQAIISAKVYGIQKVAQVYQISRSTLMRWIAKFEDGGSAGFAVGAGRGRRSRLSDGQKQEVHAWVLQEGARLTAKHAQQYIAEHFAIEISHTTAFRLLKSLGFSYITPRPKHHKQDTSEQEVFKKKSGHLPPAST